MHNGAPLAEIYRAEFLESLHVGHAVIVGPDGEIEEVWGEPDTVVLPRSSIKMIQALPLVESGAADNLTDEHLALACASHNGEPRHVERVSRWLADLGLSEDDLICGPQASRDRELRHRMIREGKEPGRILNNCSGKHTGFLTLTRHLGAGPNYVAPDHPVQVAVREAFEDLTGMPSPGFGIDGCSAPNFATTMTGLARAMARFARAREDGGTRERASVRLRQAMMAHPGLVAGEGRACTEIMRAAGGRVAVKTGAEGVFTGIVPESGHGIALKVADGATRAAEIAIVALLVRLGVFAADDEIARVYLERPISNRDGLIVGAERAAPGLVTSG